MLVYLMSDKRPAPTSRPAWKGEQVRRRDVSEHVAHAIGRRIVTGLYAPGTLLPTELELCVALGVSRPALREGFRLLGARGLIVGRRKVGTQVRSRADWNMLDAQVLAWHLEQEPSDSYISRLFEARMVVEPAAAALAASRRGAAGIAAIEAAYQGMCQAQAAYLDGSAHPGDPADPDEVTETVAADLRFHVAVLAAADNVFLSSFGAVIGSSLTAAFRLNWRSHASAPELSLAQHEAVLAAIRDGDGERAASSMRALLDSAGEDAREALARVVRSSDNSC